VIDFHETWYVHYPVGFYFHLYTFEFPTINNTNMMAV